MDTTDALVTCEIAHGLCTLRLNRPEKLNALMLETFRQLAAHLDKVDWSAIGCVLLTGAGRSFCAGHDLDALASADEAGLETERFEGQVLDRLTTLPLPVVAAVRGHCFTGGLELALAADIIVAAETARFADTHSKWDLVPVWGMTQRLPRRIGGAKAKEMMFSGRSYSGREALEIRLADLCFPDAKFEEEVARLCSDILATSRRSNAAVKRIMAETDGLPLSAGLAGELFRGPGHGPESLRAVARSRKLRDRPRP